jgi:hypothetical protein
MADLLLASVVGTDYPEVHTFTMSAVGALTLVDSGHPIGLSTNPSPDPGQVISSLSRVYFCYTPTGGDPGQLCSFHLDAAGGLASLTYEPTSSAQPANGVETDGNLFFVWSFGASYFWVYKDVAGDLTTVNGMSGPNVAPIRSIKTDPNHPFIFVLCGDTSGQGSIYSGTVDVLGNWTTIHSQPVPNTPATSKYPISMVIVGDFLITGATDGQIDSWSISGSGVLTHVDTYNVVGSGTEPAVSGLMVMQDWIIAVVHDDSIPRMQILSLELGGSGNLSLVEQYGVNAELNIPGRERQLAQLNNYFYVPTENGIYLGSINLANGDLLGGSSTVPGTKCFSLTRPRLLSPAHISGYTVNHNGSRRWPNSTVRLIDESSGEVVDTVVSDDMGWFEFSTWEITKTFTVVADAPGVRAGARSGITPVI